MPLQGICKSHDHPFETLSIRGWTQRPAALNHRLGILDFSFSCNQGLDERLNASC